MTIADLDFLNQHSGVIHMGKEQKTKKMDKKKPLLTAKEKKAAKRDKKADKRNKGLME
jgi:hypothetical protein